MRLSVVAGSSSSSCVPLPLPLPLKSSTYFLSASSCRGAAKINRLQAAPVEAAAVAAPAPAQRESPRREPGLARSAERPKGGEAADS